MKPFLSLFLLVTISVSVHAQRAFEAELVTTKNDTLRGEISFDMKIKLPDKTKAVYFSTRGERIRRIRAKKLKSMRLTTVRDRKVYHYYNMTIGENAYLFSAERNREIGSTLYNGGFVTSTGDTIYGKYQKVLSAGHVPIEGAEGRAHEIATYFFTFQKETYYLVNMAEEGKRPIFLKPLIKGSLSYYQSLIETVEFTPGMPGSGFNGRVDKYIKATDYLCKDGLGCRKFPEKEREEIVRLYTGDCESFPTEEYLNYGALSIVLEYNKKCSDTVTND